LSYASASGQCTSRIPPCQRHIRATPARAGRTRHMFWIENFHATRQRVDIPPLSARQRVESWADRRTLVRSRR